ncbi:MAG: hypothetical protein JXR40_01890 [Pontiellaceae bacterium]|nr:hypothetical protein [Pontiellaceae bacterium]
MKHTPWIAASTLITMLSLNLGCTSSSTTQTNISMPTMPAVSVAPTTPAESNISDMEAKLIGQWKLNTDAIKANLTAELESQSGSEDTKEMAEMVMQMVDQMTMIIEFTADNTVTIKTSMMGEEQTEENEWVLDSVDGNKLTLIINEKPSIVMLISDNVMEMVATEDEAMEAPPGMNRLRLDRVK